MNAPRTSQIRIGDQNAALIRTSPRTVSRMPRSMTTKRTGIASAIGGMSIVARRQQEQQPASRACGTGPADSRRGGRRRGRSGSPSTVTVMLTSRRALPLRVADRLAVARQVDVQRSAAAASGRGRTAAGCWRSRSRRSARPARRRGGSSTPGDEAAAPMTRRPRFDAAASRGDPVSVDSARRLESDRQAPGSRTRAARTSTILVPVACGRPRGRRGRIDEVQTDEAQRR